MNHPRCTSAMLACKAFAAFISTGCSRWKSLPRRDPTRELFDECHRDKPIREDYGRRARDERTRRIEEFALSVLTPLRGRTFATRAAIARAAQLTVSRLDNWCQRHASVKALVHELLGHQAEPCAP